jgi:3-deoxy-manno-octulosonate cytidylyltransferase (CMP-KDO synthetase)
MKDELFSVVAMIPAHLASVRFPRKILFDIHGLPMIEHVRRRALMCSSLERVIVATCDEEIISVIQGFGGEVIRTSNTHQNGTTRVAEAIKLVECSHVILLQGDEPLLLPRHIDSMVSAIRENPINSAWNATGPIEGPEELDRYSFVKCAISPVGQIMHCFRRSPYFSDYTKQRNFVRKILGMIAYRKDFLSIVTDLEPTPVERLESIEQMRIIEGGYRLKSVDVEPSYPSVNERQEIDIVLEYARHNEEQQALLSRLLAGKLASDSAVI